MPRKTGSFHGLLGGWLKFQGVLKVVTVKIRWMSLGVTAVYLLCFQWSPGIIRKARSFKDLQDLIGCRI